MTSVKKWIDKRLKDKHIPYFEYNKFNEIVEIGSGGLCKAELANTGIVTPKCFVDEYSNIEGDNLNRIDDEFVK